MKHRNVFGNASGINFVTKESCQNPLIAISRGYLDRI